MIYTDTTGAGDLFAAGFLCGLVCNFGYEAAAGRLGALASAEAAQHIGGGECLCFYTEPGETTLEWVCRRGVQAFLGDDSS